MNNDQFNKVSQCALKAWNDFEKDTDPKTLAACFDRSRSHFAAFGVVFYQFCAAPAKTPIYNFARLAPKISSVSGWEGRPASWLFHLGNNVPAIVVDLGYVRSASPEVERRKVLEKLFLHEVGHFLLHWNELTRNNSTWLGPSTIEQEQEAWLFSRIVQGLANTWIARNYRDKKPPCHDDTWLHP